MLTPKREKYVLNLTKGMSQREAYKKAGFSTKNMKDKDIDNEACKLFKIPEVNTRYKELIAKLEDESIMTAKERMIWLSNVVKNVEREELNIETKDDKIEHGYRNADLSTKIKAIDTLNKMSGEYKTILDGGFEVKKKLEDLL